MVVIACVGGAFILLIAIAAGGFALLNRGPSASDELAAVAEAPEPADPLEGIDDGFDDGGLEDEDTEDADGEADGQSGSPEGSTVQPGDLEYSFESLTLDLGTVTGPLGDNEPTDEYVKVAFEVENHGDEMVIYSNTPHRLVDTDGVEYSFDLEATGANRDTLDFSHNIEPGDRGLVEIIFDIPADAEPYYLEVSDRGGNDPTANMSLQ